MKKPMIQMTAIGVATLMAVSMIGCSGKQEAPADAEQTTLVNPITEMSEEEMMQQTGIALPAPEGATDIVYSVIATEDGDIAQISFDLNGDAMYLRACFTDITDLAGDTADVDWSRGDISGLYYEWNTAALNQVQDRDAIVQVSKDGPGYVAWLDVAPGVLYNLCMEDNADADKLITIANEIFVPLQGEA